MRLIPVYLILIALVAITFAWWGLETETGRQNFDEMDGMIPFFSGVGGFVFLILSLLMLIFQRRR